MDDEALAAIIHDPDVELFAVVDATARDVGMLELDFREPGECELAFVGLVPELAGQGHGRWLLAEALRRAWRDGVSRVHVHTCSLDHPAALSAYAAPASRRTSARSSVSPTRACSGILPRDCAPQVPLFGAAPSAS